MWSLGVTFWEVESFKKSRYQLIGFCGMQLITKGGDPYKDEFEKLCCGSDSSHDAIKQISKLIAAGEIRLQIPSKKQDEELPPNKFLNTLDSCLNIDRTKRPTAAHLVKRFGNKMKDSKNNDDGEVLEIKNNENHGKISSCYSNPSDRNNGYSNVLYNRSYSDSSDDGIEITYNVKTVTP